MKSQARRLPPEERKAQILEAAVSLAEVEGYTNITMVGVAEAAKLRAHGLITHYFKTIDALKKQVMEKAIKTENVEIILQGLVVKDPLALKAPAALKKRAQYKLTAE